MAFSWLVTQSVHVGQPQPIRVSVLHGFKAEPFGNGIVFSHHPHADECASGGQKTET